MLDPNRASESKKIAPLSSGSPEKDWMQLAEQASHEPDPQKLMKIVKDLCTALDGEPKPPTSSPALNSDSRKAKERSGS
jgi:hypothetical protein